jgi:AcrR family transcriptional regulator
MSAPDRREQIILCAMRLFEHRSFNEVSTSDVARAAGVGRPLINHYFGTKRELYLEVVRRFSYIPEIVVIDLQDGTLNERIDASIDRWLSVAARHRNMWLTMITASSGFDQELALIQRNADAIAVERLLAAIGLDGPGLGRGRLRTLLLAYGGMARVASRLWLRDAALSQEDIHALLSKTLKTIVQDVEDIANGTERSSG